MRLGYHIALQLTHCCVLEPREQTQRFHPGCLTHKPYYTEGSNSVQSNSICFDSSNHEDGSLFGFYYGQNSRCIPFASQAQYLELPKMYSRVRKHFCSLCSCSIASQKDFDQQTRREMLTPIFTRLPSSGLGCLHANELHRFGSSAGDHRWQHPRLPNGIYDRFGRHRLVPVRIPWTMPRQRCHVQDPGLSGRLQWERRLRGRRLSLLLGTLRRRLWRRDMLPGLMRRRLMVRLCDRHLQRWATSSNRKLCCCSPSGSHSSSFHGWGGTSSF